MPFLIRNCCPVVNAILWIFLILTAQILLTVDVQVSLFSHFSYNSSKIISIGRKEMLRNSKITIEGRQLKSVYAVYVIELNHNGDSYFYIGQTGDAHYISARPAFSRIGGHLENTDRSTQNQIYKFIVQKLGISVPVGANDYSRNDKGKVEHFLSESKITMYIYPLLEFDYMLTRDEHHSRREKILEFEKQVIRLFEGKGKTLINQTRHRPRQALGSVFPDKFTAIEKEFFS